MKKTNLNQYTPEVDVLPTPAESARIINEKTIPVSLRINEKTQAFFDEQSSTYGVSGNVMMSLLLDRYVEYQDNVASKGDTLNLAILSKHLERCAKMVKKLDNVTILRHILNEGDSLAAMSATSEDIESILQDYVIACNGDSDSQDLDLHIWTVDADFHCIEDGANKPAILDAEYARDTNTFFYDLYIPPEKWPVVVYIAKSYEFKMQQLFPGDNEFKINQRAMMGKQFYQELINIINSTEERADLAQKLAAAYL